ncbi:hypothetical protein H4R26_001784 [Coemansia thaxteri]|uniref:Histone-lysine N-methyltransferase n=1 Tax=Coemansia thaxteri TaxID=2663907 RepID=A0A9W8BHU8_9FUNG|nr:hypothetical protein H4R26_001784 [Coemansia thaxteri]
MKTRIENTADVSKFYELLKDAKGKAMSVVNTVDTVGCPEGFTYINESIYSAEVPVPCPAMFGCECKDNCGKDCECSHPCNYDQYGLLKKDAAPQLVECGPKCACSDKCLNRLVQKGSNVEFELRRFVGKGWGVVTKQKLKRGTFVAEYVGEVISNDEGNQRGHKDMAQGMSYMFDLDSEFTGEVADFTIDAKTHGNISAFFNHSCDPNMKACSVYIEHRDPRLHHLAFFATRNVMAGEELAFDYSPSREEGKLTTTCHCGARKCRKTMSF